MMPPREEGAALLSVLMIVAVLSAIAVMTLDRLKIATLTARNAETAQQARADMRGIEATALAAIDRLAAVPDALASTDWQARTLTLPVAGGFATARIADGGNCFNVNSLVTEEDGARVASRAGRDQFIALMRLTEVPEGDAQRVADAATDWIDSDAAPTGMGGEDALYAAQPTPTLPANTLMADASELRAVAGVTPDIYARLAPWVCALPEAALSPLNVNTLTAAQAPLLAMLNPLAADIGAARARIERRPPGGWRDLVGFWEGQPPPPADVLAQPTLRTRWVTARITVEIGGVRVDETVLIDAARRPARIVQRRWGDE